MPGSHVRAWLAPRSYPGVLTGGYCGADVLRWLASRCHRTALGAQTPKSYPFAARDHLRARHNTAQYMKPPCSRYPCGHTCRHLCWTIITVTGILLYFSRLAYLSFCMTAISLCQERPSPMNHKLSGYGMGRIVKTRAVMAQARIDRTADGVHPSDERPLR